MNESHKIGKKKNRVARLARKLNIIPPVAESDRKRDRKTGLIYELSKAGVKV